MTFSLHGASCTLGDIALPVCFLRYPCQNSFQSTSLNAWRNVIFNFRKPVFLNLYFTVCLKYTITISFSGNFFYALQLYVEQNLRFAYLDIILIKTIEPFSKRSSKNLIADVAHFCYHIDHDDTVIQLKESVNFEHYHLPFLFQ